MGLLDYNLEEVPELEVLPPDEYLLEIVKAETKMDKNGNPGIKVTLKADKPNTKLIGTWISLPAEGDDEDRKNAKLRRVKTFVECFNIQKHDDDEDLQGATGYAILKLTESDEYGQQNEVSRFVSSR